MKRLLQRKARFVRNRRSVLVRNVFKMESTVDDIDIYLRRIVLKYSTQIDINLVDIMVVQVVRHLTTFLFIWSPDKYQVTLEWVVNNSNHIQFQNCLYITVCNSFLWDALCCFLGLPNWSPFLISSPQRPCWRECDKTQPNTFFSVNNNLCFREVQKLATHQFFCYWQVYLVMT